LVFAFLFGLVGGTAAAAEYSVSSINTFYCGKGTVNCRGKLGMAVERNGASVFGALRSFDSDGFTVDVVVDSLNIPAANNTAYEVGAGYSFPNFGKNKISISASYYDTISYEKGLIMRGSGDIYTKASLGLDYGYDVDFFNAGIIYEKLFDSYKSSFGFNIEKSVLRGKYLSSYAGYNLKWESKTTDVYGYSFNNMKYRMKKELDSWLVHEHKFYYKISMNISNISNLSLVMERVLGDSSEDYYSWGVGFGLKLW
jgi:hypothetical protein